MYRSVALLYSTLSYSTDQCTGKSDREIYWDAIIELTLGNHCFTPLCRTSAVSFSRVRLIYPSVNMIRSTAPSERNQVTAEAEAAKTLTGAVLCLHAVRHRTAPYSACQLEGVPSCLISASTIICSCVLCQSWCPCDLETELHDCVGHCACCLEGEHGEPDSYDTDGTDKGEREGVSAYEQRKSESIPSTHSLSHFICWLHDAVVMRWKGSKMTTIGLLAVICPLRSSSESGYAEGQNHSI